MNVDANKVKNFIMHNKKKIRSRSKPHTHQNTQAEQSSHRSQNRFQQKKKSSIKQIGDMKEIFSDDEIELYQAQDQQVQTSFELP